jgi:DNA-binding PadR family transcriptional regulator
MSSLYERYYMAKKSKYRQVCLDLLSSKPVSTNQIIKDIKKKTGKSVHWYLVSHVLDDLAKEGKAEKQEIKLGSTKLFMWKKR